jgi:hypothetical protein
MHESHKVVPVDGANYRIARMTPLVGGYIWQRLLSALYKAQDGRKTEDEQAPLLDAPKPSTEERMRGMCGVTFMFLSFEDFQFVQKHCMQMIEREEPAPAGYLRVQLDDGRWAVPEIAANPLLVTKLMVEALVFSLHPFLA